MLLKKVNPVEGPLHKVTKSKVEKALNVMKTIKYSDHQVSPVP